MNNALEFKTSVSNLKDRYIQYLIHARIFIEDNE